VEDRRAPLGARRAAVLAVLGCTLLVTLLVTWAASIGPGSVLEGKGADLLTFTGGPTPTESFATPMADVLEEHPPPGDPPAYLMVIAVVIETIVAALLLVGLYFAVRALLRLRFRRPEPEVEVEFDVLEPPRRVADVMTQDRDEQRRLLLSGDPRNGIVACWDRFEVQAARAGVPPQPWETAAEHTLRILDLVDADQGAVSALAGLFREARFSEHEVTEDSRQQAVAALDRIHATLLSPQGGRS